MLERAWADLGEAPSALDAVRSRADAIPLRSRLAVGPLVHDAVAAAALSAAVSRASDGAIPTVELEPDRVATAVTSERHFRYRGEPMSAWAELSGFWPTADGWLRTHANYPHHRARLLRALDLSADATADDLRIALAARSAADADDAITAAGGVATLVRSETEWARHPHAAVVDAQPLVRLERRADAAPAATERPRVLDLTRVIAGPVATRTLALWGADVLRIDPPGMPELEWQHLDTGAGKRSAVLDARSAEFDRLLRSADVVVTGYRSDGVTRLGLSPEELAERAPGLIVARITAWGTEGPFAHRRGFDSIVQAATGIGWIESADGSAPGAMPAQALDHSAGYLLAAAITTALRRRSTEGGTWLAEVSLARVAHELLGMPRSDRAPAPDFEPTLVTLGDVVLPQPAPHFDGSPDSWPAAPVPWGSSSASWRQ